MMNEIEKEIKRMNSLQETENGALGYSTTGKELVDLNFKVPSFRNGVNAENHSDFSKAMREDLIHSIKWLFYVRDVREGLGERRAFVELFSQFYEEHTVQAKNVISLISEYGRWKDVFDIINYSSNSGLTNDCLNAVKVQLKKDVEAYNAGNSISLLAKWVPSINASKKVRGLAISLRDYLGMSSCDYRKMLAKLRERIGIIEAFACANNWGEIDYEHVPSKANLKYKDAFLKHDENRRRSFLEAVLNASADEKPKINASVLYPYEIWHKYCANNVEYRYGPWGYGYGSANIITIGEDASLEALWQNLKNIDCGGNTMVVCDGSGSMTVSIGANSGVQAIDVSRSLSVYFAERCEGEFKNKFIEFSKNPHFIDISECRNLRDKIAECYKHEDCSNTDIEKVFMLILDAAKKNNMKQSDLPARILIVSDMEFDCATQITGRWGNNGDYMAKYKTLFETLADRYKECGYTLPKLVFWNVNSRTNTMPLTENEAGIILVSGFSVNIAKMVMSGKTDPWDALRETLDTERYAPVEKALTMNASR